MRQMLEQQRQGQPTRVQQLGDQPMAGTVEQEIDGSQAPPLAQQEQPTQEPSEAQLSDNANRRIRELIAELREKDQALQKAMELGRSQGDTLGQLKQKFDQLQQQHQNLIQANLENLDPETRMLVMQDSRIQEALSGLEQRILGQLMPHIQTIEQKNQQAEMMRLGDIYPAFDIQIHGPLIDMFRGKNPHCSIEQAYRAIAEPGELVTREAASAAAVPPVVPPGNMGARPRYQPEPQGQQSNPEQELIEEAQMLKKLRSSSDPSDQKAGMNLVHEHLKRRLGL